jgi:Fe-S cluster biosynthesis and repair protein YggX
MSRTVHCVKLNREAEGLERLPYPGELGKRIFDSVSKEAWQQWLQHQTMLINEYRLNPLDPKSRTFIEEQMQKFFFEDEAAELPPDYKPQA